MMLWRDGKSVLTDHVHDAEVRTLASGTVVALDESRVAHPVVCGWIVMVNTEDGPMDGRCAAPIILWEEDACLSGHSRPPSWIDDPQAAADFWGDDLDLLHNRW